MWRQAFDMPVWMVQALLSYELDEAQLAKSADSVLPKVGHLMALFRTHLFLRANQPGSISPYPGREHILQVKGVLVVPD